MRQGQQHRRGRSRGGQQGNNGQNQNQNRKGQNPLSRSYQSNGPDGKVSGTAQSVAEKYLSLARDAHSSGDPVLAENYLQHAEHYNRIILAYREQLAQGAPEEGGQGGQGRTRPQGQPGSDQGDEGGDDEGGEPYGRDMQPLPPMEARPRAFEGPRESNRDGNRQDSNRQDGARQDGNRFDDRQQPRPQRERFQPRDRYGADRGERGERFNGERGDRFNGERNAGTRGERYPDYRGERGERGERQQNGERAPREQGFAERPRVSESQPPAEVVAPAARADVPAAIESSEQRPPRPVRRERPAPVAAADQHEQPEFLRRPVRRPRREAASEENVPPAASQEPESSES